MLQSIDRIVCRVNQASISYIAKNKRNTRRLQSRCCLGKLVSDLDFECLSLLIFRMHAKNAPLVFCVDIWISWTLRVAICMIVFFSFWWWQQRLITNSTLVHIWKEDDLGLWNSSYFFHFSCGSFSFNNLINFFSLVIQSRHEKEEDLI